MKYIDAASHTRGESQYVDDLPQPKEMLYAAIFPSPIAHGKILEISVQQACKLEGVVGVFTAQDIPGENEIGTIIQDEPLLADQEVHYIGQPIAVVVGESNKIARQACQNIYIKFQELTPIIDPREAFAKGEIIGTPRTFVLGDVDKAWQECDVIVEGNCEIGGQEHIYLETQRARAIPLEQQGMRIYSSTQSPYLVQKAVAKILGWPHHRVEVDVKRLGGGFGGKEDQATSWACMAGLAAFHLQKPVELVLSRAEDIKITGKRHPYSSDFKIGLSKEGKILAYEVKHYQNAGASADLSPAILERTLFHSTNSYFIPNVRIFAASCRTNLPPNTAFRGFGGPQGMFVIEAAIAKAAQTLGVPKEEIQYKNLLRDGDVFPYGQKCEKIYLQKTWDKALEIYDFPRIREDIESYNQAHFESKKGYAIMPICFGISFTNIMLNQASALVHIYTDGSVSVSTGGVEMGQGLNTKLAMIAANSLGISQERVKIETTNTTRIANMSPTAASATTDLNGNAIISATKQILTRLQQVVAKEFKLDSPQEVSIENEKVLYKGKEIGYSWEQLILTAYLSRTNLSAHAYYATPKIWFDKKQEKGDPFAYHVVGTAIVEVTLDCLRGTYTIDHVKIVHELGRPINKLIDLGQVEGGLVQGLGWMTLEDLQFSSKGELLSNSLATYKVPDVYFVPEIQVTFLEDKENPLGPYGSKAVGEPPLMYGIGVFFAIQHAIHSFRPNANWLFHTPLTPERVLLALYSKLELKNNINKE